MVEPVSLNKARKAKAHAGAKAQAVVNRVKFGRTKGEKAAGASEAHKARATLDGAKRET